MDALIVGAATIVMMIVCGEVAKWKARRAVRNTVYMVRPKKDR